MSRSTVAEPPPVARRQRTWGELANEFPIRQEVLLAAGAGLCFVVFYSTMMKPPGIAVWINYLCGFAGALFAGFLLAKLIPLGNRSRWTIASVFAIVMMGVWARYDHFHDHWPNSDGDQYKDLTHRWSGKVVHRTLALKNHVHSHMFGPMDGDPETPHGRWEEIPRNSKQPKKYAWFWYGKRISQGEWETLNRRS